VADHLRTQIRDAAVLTLTGLSTTGANVFPTRSRAIAVESLPALRVYCDDESIETASMGPDRERKRTMSLVVEGITSTNASPEDTADQIVKEVELALDGNNSLGGLVKYIEPRRVGIEIAHEADKLVAVARMEFEVLYYSRKGAPDVAQ
jgi:hypothetical protein